MKPMTTNAAKEILSYNVLNLRNAGIDHIPAKFVQIETFNITQIDEKNHCKHATLLGMIDKSDSFENISVRPHGDYCCTSFMVKVGLDYYYRDFFYEALDVIKALRIKNGYDLKEWEEFWQ